MTRPNTLKAFVAAHEETQKELKNQLHNTPLDSPELLNLAKQVRDHRDGLLPGMQRFFSL